MIVSVPPDASMRLQGLDNRVESVYQRAKARTELNAWATVIPLTRS